MPNYNLVLPPLYPALCSLPQDHSVKSPKECADIFRGIWEYNTMHKHERFYALYFNSKHEPIFHKLLNIGSYSECNFDIRSAVAYLLESPVNIVAIAHNHPSGSLAPSETDIQLTKTIIAALSPFEIDFLDHIILTVDGYYSFRENKLIVKSQWCYPS